MSDNRKTFKSLLKRVFRHPICLFVSLALTLVTVFGSLYLPILTGRVIDLIVGEQNVDFSALKDILFNMGIVIGITALAQYFMGLFNNRLSFLIARDIRNEAFTHIQKIPFSYLDVHPSGETLSTLISDVEQITDGLLMGFTQFFSGILTIIGTLAFMIYVSVPITLVVVIITPASLIVADKVAKKTYSLFKAQSEIRGEQTAYIDEMITGEKVVQAFSKESDVLKKFDEMNEKLTQASLKATFTSSLTNPSTRFVNSLVYTGVCIAGAIGVLSGYLSVGDLTIFLSYANQYTKPFNEISGVFAELQNAFACASRVFAILDEEVEEEDDDEAIELDLGKDGRKTASVEFKDVSFSYVPEKPLIENLDLFVKPGARIAIVGPTGAGKTTLINLLMRFYDVKGGNICIGDRDIRKYTKKSLRDNFGMVLQETWLFSGSIKDNIKMGNPDASDEDVINAAKAVHSHSFIRRLPDGYDTIIGEDGGSLSQGQKQLLCITRAMLSLPSMLILDEATSSIDTRTELKIQNAFATLMKGKTSFIVAHRLSTITNADLILVMKDGHIIEQGTHEELLSNGGFYSQLYAG